MAQGSDTRTIAVIDGNSLMHRAFHAISQPMSAPDGRPTNALFGFFNMFVKFIETFNPDGVICAFDKGQPKVRIALYEAYKAQRPPMDPALHEQFPMVKDLLRALDVPVVELAGWEGDDILGTLARRGEAAGYEMLLVTGDRDMYQLSTDKVKIVSTRKGTSDVAIMTPESVEDLYHGITPQLVPDFYGLKGDSSDNIPGVPGIGPKKASALIAEYGSLDGVITHADEVPGKMGENLRAHIDDALLSRKLATILTDAPIELDLADARFPSFDPTRVAEAFSVLGFTGMVKRILKLGGSEALAAMPAAQTQLELPKLKSGEKALKAAETLLGSDEWVGAVLVRAEEQKGQTSLDLFAETPADTLWLSCNGELLELDATPSLIAQLFASCKLVSPDIKALAKVSCPADSSREAALISADIDTSRIFDTSLAAYLLDSDRSSYEVVALAQQRGFVLPEPSDKFPTEAIAAVAATLVREPLLRELEQDDSLELYQNIELPLLPVLLSMERAGLHVDSSVLAQQSSELGAEIEQMVASIHEAAGEEFNLDSPMQLSHVLFEVLQLPTFGLKKTKRGYYSTNAQVLADLAANYPIVSDVLEYRERAKIKNTYLDALPELVAGDGRIHTSLNQTIAATGRLSSSDPNLQNIPTRSDLGHRVRQAFTVSAGNVFLACDYSQIELRLLAHLSQDEHLIAAFCSGEDFHAQTAARVFGVGLDEVSPQMRARAKAVNFGIVYGQQAYGLASSLKIGRNEAQEMIDRYYEAYPQVREFLDECVRSAHEKGYAITMYGRKRHIHEFAPGAARNLVAYGERTAMNHPMQGSAADIIKLAMIEVERRLREEGLASKLVLQIHDELDFEVPEAELEQLSALVKQTMERVATLSVPLIAEVSYGANWAEAK